jgi:hypothetical protein
MSPRSSRGGPDDLDALIETADPEYPQLIVGKAAERHEDVARAVRLGATRGSGDLSQLRAEIDRGPRTIRYLGYRESGGSAMQARSIMEWRRSAHRPRQSLDHPRDRRVQRLAGRPALRPGRRRRPPGSVCAGRRARRLAAAGRLPARDDRKGGVRARRGDLEEGSHEGQRTSKTSSPSTWQRCGRLTGGGRRSSPSSTRPGWDRTAHVEAAPGVMARTPSRRLALAATRSGGRRAGPTRRPVPETWPGC